MSRRTLSKLAVFLLSLSIFAPFQSQQPLLDEALAEGGPIPWALYYQTSGNPVRVWALRDGESEPLGLEVVPQSSWHISPDGRYFLKLTIPSWGDVEGRREAHIALCTLPFSSEGEPIRTWDIVLGEEASFEAGFRWSSTRQFSLPFVDWKHASVEGRYVLKEAENRLVLDVESGEQRRLSCPVPADIWQGIWGDMVFSDDFRYAIYPAAEDSRETF